MREGYKKSPVGEIPSDWILKTIGDEVKFEGGAQPPKEYFINEEKEGYIRLIQIRDYKTDNYLTYIPIDMARKFCTEDDIMIGRYGPPIFQILKGIKGAYNVALLKAIPNEKILNKEYTRYFLSTEKLFKLIDRLSQRTSGQTGVDMEALNNYLIPIPPLKEQEEIVAVLSTVDSQIGDTEKLIEKSKELKKGLMQKLLTKGIGHSEFKKTEIAEIPVSWEVKKLEDISTVVMGQSPRSESYNEDKKGIPFFQGNSEFGRMYPTIKKWCNEPSKIAEPMDILISVRAPVGAVNLNKCKSCIGRGLAAVRSNNNSDYMYLYYILSYSEKVLNSSAQGSTFTAINSGDLKGLRIAMPKLEEQRNIGQILLSIDNEIEVYENKKQKLEELKKGLMQQLLTGKIRTV